MGTLADMYTASLSSNEDTFLRSLPDFFQANGWGPDASSAWADSINNPQKTPSASGSSGGGVMPTNASAALPTFASGADIDRNFYSAPSPAAPYAGSAKPAATLPSLPGQPAGQQPMLASAGTSASTGLSPDILAQLKGLTSPSQTVTIDGMTYGVLGQEQNNEGGYSFTPQSYTAFKAGTPMTPGAQGLQYSLDGSGSALPYQLQNGGQLNASDFKDLWDVAKTLGPMALGGYIGAGGFGGVAGDAAGGSGAFVGEGATSGIDAWDAALENASVGQVAGTVAGGDIGLNGVGNVDNYAISQGAPGTLGEGYLTTGSALGGLTGAAAGSGAAGLTGGTAGAVGGATGGLGAATGGLGAGAGGIVSTLGGTGGVLGGIGSIISGLGGIASGQSGSNLADSLRQELDPFAKYRDQYAQKLNSLWADPSTVTGMPGYQAGLTAVQRSLGAQGFQGSGNMMNALSEYGGGFFDKTLGQLETLSGANMNLGAQAGTIANLNSASQGSTGYGVSQLLQGLGGLVGNNTSGVAQAGV